MTGELDDVGELGLAVGAGGLELETGATHWVQIVEVEVLNTVETV